MTIHSSTFKERFATFLNLIGRPCEKKPSKLKALKKKYNSKNSKIKAKKSLKKKRYKKNEISLKI